MITDKKEGVSALFFIYHLLTFGPPYWLMISFARAGFGFLIRTGYCSFFS